MKDSQYKQLVFDAVNVVEEIEKELDSMERDFE